MCLLIFIIVDIPRGCIDDVAQHNQHAYITDLCKRGDQAQDFIHQKLSTELIPAATESEKALQKTETLLRAERKRLIEAKMKAMPDPAAASTKTTTTTTTTSTTTTTVNGGAATTAAAAAPATAAADPAAAAQLASMAAAQADLEAQLAEMRSKLADQDAKLKGGEHADAAAGVMAKAQEQNDEANKLLDNSRAAQQARMKERLAERRSAKQASIARTQSTAAAQNTANAAAVYAGSTQEAPADSDTTSVNLIY